VVSLSHLEEVAGGIAGKMRYWLMSDQALADYRADPQIKGFELQISACSWRERFAE
jgi:hypothetical protein